MQTLLVTHLRSATIVVFALGASQSMWANPPASKSSGEQAVAQGEAKTLRFSFDRAPWRSVLSWAAEEAGLALYISELPTGTFTYSDPNTFTPAETIDRINLFLIPQGYTFVRSGNLLSLISLGDPQSMKQLDAMAEFVSVNKLQSRGNYDVVKCIFPLGSVDSAEVLSELSGLDLITQPTVLPRSNQLLITDTAGKLKTVKAILDSLEAPGQRSEQVRSFALQHTDAEDVLTAARSHLGIEPGEMSGFDVNLSTDNKGRRIFATGTRQQIEVLGSLIKAMDDPGESVAARDRSVLRSHRVSGDNLRSVYDVLQTLLADQTIRLSEDEATNSIVAFAPHRAHELIQSTIVELDGASQEFAVIDLKTAEVYSTVAMLNELFGVTESLRDDDDETADTPKFHIDPRKNRLYVRAKPNQIEQVRRVVESLVSQPENSGKVRVIRSYGARSDEILDAAKQLWRGDNPILFLPSAPASDEGSERTAHPDPRKDVNPKREPAAQSTAPATGRPAEPPREPREAVDVGRSFLPGRPRAEPLLLGWADAPPARTREPRTSASDRGSPIRVRLTPQGILIQSEDSRALSRFEEHLRLVAQSVDAPTTQPIVFYLKYAKADEATRMLADMLDGARWLGDPTNRTLVKGLGTARTASRYWGSLVLNQDGTTTMTAGSATVVSDARLNRLIVQGTAEDISLIEGYLKIIDKDTSITQVETRGRSRVVELVHAKASEVAAVIRDVYAGRIAGGGQGTPQRGSENDEDQPDRDGNESQGRDQEERRPAPKPTRDREPEMTVAVHQTSNSLIITAPDQLFQEVERLVRLVDQRAEQSVEVLAPGALNPEYVDALLQNVLLGRTDRERRGGSRPARNGSRPDRENSDRRRERGREGD